MYIDLRNADITLDFSGVGVEKDLTEEQRIAIIQNFMTKCLVMEKYV